MQSLATIAEAFGWAFAAAGAARVAWLLLAPNADKEAATAQQDEFTTAMRKWTKLLKKAEQ